mgnify:CR=1 FL=1|tara:strand:+ start:354 stop:515 length:162 start_codon:yes stop_codon:yes gene_type:complete
MTRKYKWWKEHQEFLKKFTDCETITGADNVSSSNKKKVQRKTNKSIKSSEANV